MGMLTGTDCQYASGIQQAAIPPPYQDQVRAAGLAAWNKLEEGPSESPILGLHQKANEDLPSFIDRVEKSIKKKLPPGDLRDHFLKMAVWEGMTRDHRMACAGLKERSMDRWVIATKDIGSTSHQARAMAAALKEHQQESLETLVCAIQQTSLQSHPRTHLVYALVVDKRGISRETAHRAVSPSSLNLLSCHGPHALHIPPLF